MARKGIILAGGSGTRLYPLTKAVSKQLLPVYNKPLIYYPLSVLMLSGIREIAIITTPHDQTLFRELLGDGSNWGLSLSYITQEKPNGIAEAYILAEEFLDGDPSALILGDNLFFGHDLPKLLEGFSKVETASVIGHQVRDPERYGVVDFDASGKVQGIIEKPKEPPSRIAVTGLYYLPGNASEVAKTLTPSARGELEITDLLEMYLKDGALEVAQLGRGFAWFDTGTHDSLLDAANFVRSLETRQHVQLACLEEIALSKGWIDRDTILNSEAVKFKNDYGEYLRDILG